MSQCSFSCQENRDISLVFHTQNLNRAPNLDVFTLVADVGSILQQISFIILRIARLQPKVLSCDPKEVTKVLYEYHNLLNMCTGQSEYGDHLPAEVIKYQAKKLGLR